MTLILYSIILLLFSIYSYALIDVNLTLVNNKYWEYFRGIMVNFGYNQRELSSIVYICFVVLLFGFFWYFAKNYKKYNPLVIAGIVGGILLFSYPFLSHDLFSYIFDAKIVTFYHQNPYLMRPQDFPGDPWLRFLHWTHRTYPYGPTFLIMTLIPSLLAGTKFILHFMLFKLMYVVFYFASVWSLNKLNKKWAIIFALHPLILIEGLINTHNDLIQTCLAIIGIYGLLSNKNILISRLLMVYSAGIKFISFPLVFITKKKAIINRIIFGVFTCLMVYLSLTREIQSWYFIGFFAFLPFFENWIMKGNVFFLTLLIGNYFFIRYGVMNPEIQQIGKGLILLSGMTINLLYIFFKHKWYEELNNYKKVLLTLFFIFIALISRTFNLALTAYFVNDQGRDMMVLFDMIKNHKFTLLGPATSITAQYGNIYFGPFYYYFMLPFYLINQSPIFMTMVYSLLFIVGIILFFKLKDFNFWEKIIYSVFVISSWYVLTYTRFIWNLNLSFILSFILFSVFLIFVKRIKNSWILSLLFGLIGGSILQVHYGMIFLYISYLYFYIKNIKNGLLYVFGLILSLFPFVLFDLRHGYLISNNFLSYINSFFIPHQLSQGSFFIVFKNMYDYFLIPFINIPELYKILIAVAIYLLIIWRLWKRKSAISNFLLLTYLIFPLTYFIFKREFEYYNACFVLWFYMGLAITVYDLWTKNLLWKYTVSIGLSVFFILNIINFFFAPQNIFGINAQKIIAGSIVERHNNWYKDEINKGNKIEKINKVQVNVYPHKDDIRGIQYILLQTYGLEISENTGKEFYVCYFQTCKTKKLVKEANVDQYIYFPNKNPIHINDIKPLYNGNNLNIYVHQ